MRLKGRPKRKKGNYVKRTRKGMFRVDIAAGFATGRCACGLSPDSISSPLVYLLQLGFRGHTEKKRNGLKKEK